MKATLWKIALLGLIAFFTQTLLGTPFDLMFLLTVLAARCWGIGGGLITGGVSGALLGAVSSHPFFTVVFFYAVLGYLAALAMDIGGRGSLAQDLGRAAGLTALYVLTENSLFIAQGIARLDQWTFSSAPFHFLALALILQLSRYRPIDRGDLPRYDSVGLIRSIVR